MPAAKPPVNPIIGLGRGPNNTPMAANDGKDRGLDLWYFNTTERQAFVGWNSPQPEFAKHIQARVMAVFRKDQ